MIDNMMKKLSMPMDARGPRGVFSRGKPIYRHGSNSPKPLDLRKAIIERLRSNGPNSNK